MVAIHLCSEKTFPISNFNKVCLILKQCKRFCLQRTFLQKCDCAYPTYIDTTFRGRKICNLTIGSKAQQNQMKRPFYMCTNNKSYIKQVFVIFCFMKLLLFLKTIDVIKIGQIMAIFFSETKISIMEQSCSWHGRLAVNYSCSNLHFKPISCQHCAC